MTFEEARNLDTRKVVELTWKPAERTGSKGGKGFSFYRSPWVQEKQKTGSLQVFEDGGFKDHATGVKGGNAIDYWMAFRGTGNCNAVEALNELRGLKIDQLNPKPQEETKRPSKAVKIEIKELQHKALFWYLWNKRGVKANIARKYCVEVWKGPKWYFIGFKNDSEGYERRNGLENSKGTDGQKDITTIKGSDSSVLNVFEGFIDFLSMLQRYDVEQLKGDVIVLNSVSMVDKILPKLGQYQTVNLFLDNDEAGTGATNEILRACPTAKDQRSMYAGFNDVNDWLVNRDI